MNLLRVLMYVIGAYLGVLGLLFTFFSAAARRAMNIALSDRVLTLLNGEVMLAVALMTILVAENLDSLLRIVWGFVAQFGGTCWIRLPTADRGADLRPGEVTAHCLCELQRSVFPLSDLSRLVEAGIGAHTQSPGGSSLTTRIAQRLRLAQIIILGRDLPEPATLITEDF